MTAFPGPDFLLGGRVARALYHEVACDLPVIDYHNHLPVGQIAGDHHFRSITEVWLDGDHYKWRAMRTDGVPERFCTGDASDWEKFEAWARTVPRTVRNPLYHWTHMELQRPFGVHERLSPETARTVYERCNQRLAEPEFGCQGLLRQFKVAIVCTTDDPVDDLEHHRALASRQDPATRVYPTFRPDRAMAFGDLAAWNAWVDALGAAAGIDIGDLARFFEAFERRHALFHARGCRASDHGLESIDAEDWSDAAVAGDFARLRAGQALEPAAAARLRSALLHRMALLDHQRGWVQQYHLGAMRNNNTRQRRRLGPDTGYDSIGDFAQAPALARFLDRLDADDRLAKTILYNLNPADNEVFASMIGNFQDGSVPGKLQYGSAWWFLDQRDGMRRQMEALSNLGLFARFVGMITDSRSFLSYSRHEYFRRLVCDLLGADVEAGLLPDDRPLLAEVVRDVCYFNALRYLGLEPGTLGRKAGGAE